MTLHISSLIVLSKPEHMCDVAALVDKLEGAEITNSDQAGKSIVVLETENEKSITQSIEKLSETPGVISVSLSYHFFE